ncbi:MCM binding protein-like protein Mcb1 [Schizosaccharomyces osmophilus]|uniref:MCM binding protein-like protein Mcb1 n=1 Tax=Schizosaccharomyces osmophilus TaxID=2545709 RepID=A0AAE9WAM0_9SCHI|nr:MCM binding protein-like protein Mcb1 [Schizosaccharomyces osmophilus]WBW72734.1 MCM binding protein-like protein Mcb1 [Schizosaccharomyces osmophilus]
MVAQLSEVFLKDPQSFLQKIQDASLSNPGKPDLQGSLGIEEAVSDLFLNKDELEKIPNFASCNPNELRSGQLLRLQGMIQDTNFGHEFFAGAIKMNDQYWRGCRYILSCSEDESYVDENKMVLDERYSLFLTNIPGELKSNKVDSLDSEEENEPYKDLIMKYSNRTLGKEDFGFCVKCYGGMETRLRVCQAVDMLGMYEEPSEYSDGLPILHLITFEDFRQPSSITYPSEEEAEHLRSKLLTQFNKILGDNVASESLLLCLLSNVVHRADSFIVGSFNLNLTNCTPERASRIISLLKYLTKRTVVQKVDINELNREPLYPRSDGDTLSIGRLQLTPGTLLILDETELSSGTLNDTGVRNVAFLSFLLSQQEITFAYPFSSYNIQTDVRIIVLSHGKSILPVNAVYTSKFDEALMSSETSLSSDDLEGLSNYLNLWTRATDIPTDMLEFIQSNYVHSRRSGLQTNEKVLSIEINCSRLYAKSLASNLVSRQHFEQASSLVEQWTIP